MTAIGAGAIVRTANTIVLGRVLNDQIVVGAESCNYQLPGVTANLGFNGYKFQIVKPGSVALGVSGSSFFAMEISPSTSEKKEVVLSRIHFVSIVISVDMAHMNSC